MYYRADLENLKPDTAALQQTEMSGKVKGVIVTLKGSTDNKCVDKNGKVYDFVSRYFAPWVGIPEDPVTGKYHARIQREAGVRTHSPGKLQSYMVS